MKRSQVGLKGLSAFLILFFAMTVPDLGAQVGRGGAVPDQALPGGLKGLEIKDYFVPSSLKEVGVIHALSGTVVVIHRATKEAYFGRPGDVVFENDALNTLPDSRCRIRFFNEDVVTMAQDTEFGVDEYSDRREEGKKSSLFSMVKGKAMFYAMRLFRYKDTRFRLKTPTAIVGVRGTKFGARVYTVDGEKSAHAGVLVADSGNDIGIYLAAANPGEGGKSYTDCFCLDGYLDVAGKLVGPGEMYKGETEQVIPTPPEIVKAFEQETEVKTEEEKAAEEEKKTEEEEKKAEEEKAGEEAEEEVVVDTGETTTAETAVGITDAATDTTLQETGTQTEETSTTQTRPTRHYGYFNLFLRGTAPNWPGSAYYRSVAIQNFDSTGQVDGYRDGVDVGDLKFDGSGSETVRVTYVDVDGKVIDSGLPNVLDKWELGFNTYMEWGIWAGPEDSSLTDVDTGDTWSLWRMAFYVWGEQTPDSHMSDLASQGLTATYSGPAYGKHKQNSVGVRMDGSFSTQVNFGSASINNFNLSVSGEGHSASITNATGSFQGASSSFALDSTSGTWKVDEQTSSIKGGRGGVFGPGAESIGGIWVMKESPGSSNVAWGSFAGTR
jgi:hypothetical protein